MVDTWLVIVLVVLALLTGAGLGFYFSQRFTKKYLKENPPVSEKMIRLMFQQMGRKPSEKQVREIVRSMSGE
jgi:Uncharacterized protein conserved in bacteria